MPYTIHSKKDMSRRCREIKRNERRKNRKKKIGIRVTNMQEQSRKRREKATPSTEKFRAKVTQTALDTAKILSKKKKTQACKKP